MLYWQYKLIVKYMYKWNINWLRIEVQKNIINTYKISLQINNRSHQDKQQGYREKMSKAYDYALEHIGLDLQSYTIWNDYITFMRNFEVQGSFAENQRILQVRKIYWRGVVT